MSKFKVGDMVTPLYPGRTMNAECYLVHDVDRHGDIKLRSDDGVIAWRYAKAFELYKEPTKEKQMDIETLVNKYKGKVITLVVMLLLDEVVLKGFLRKKITDAVRSVIKDLNLGELNGKVD